MKSFNYHAPKDVKDASKLASSSSAFLAGGMTTIPSMKLGLASYKDVIDIKNIKKFLQSELDKALAAFTPANETAKKTFVLKA